MFYTIYKTTNIINNKIYIGQHKTLYLDDNYLGSGVALHRAIRKYGIDNFIKEYLFIFDNEEDMNNKEIELVSEEFIKEDTNYNLMLGGSNGGWNYVNENGLAGKFIEHTKESRLLISESIKKRLINNIGYREKHLINLKQMRKNLDIKYPNGTFYGRTHTEETKAKMRKPKNIGKENPQYGMMWIYSVIECKNKRINKNEVIPEGWYKGRKMKF